MAIYYFQIAQTRLLKANKVPIIISAKSFNYNNVFSLKFAAELSEHIGINNHINILKKGK